MFIDGGGDVTVDTSLLEASNLVVLRVHSSDTSFPFFSKFGGTCDNL